VDASEKHGHDCTIAKPCPECRKFIEKARTPTLREAESGFEKALQRVAHGESVTVARAAAQRWVAAARASALEEAADLVGGACKYCENKIRAALDKAGKGGA